MSGTDIEIASAGKEHFDLAQRQARAYAGSLLVPDTLRGSMENCLAAMMLADEMGESRLAVMQNIYFVHGRASWITAYMVGRANRSGKFRGPLRWQTVGKGADLAVECYATLAGIADDDDPRVAITVDLKTALESGWTTFRDSKNGYKLTTHPRWATPVMQEQMLRWRSAAWLIRLYAPEVMMGLPTREELDDIADREMVDVTPIPPAPKLSDFGPNGQDRTAPPAESAEPLEQKEDDPRRPESHPDDSPQEMLVEAERAIEDYAGPMPTAPTQRTGIDDGPPLPRHRRRRRTKAEMEAARAAAGTPTVPPDTFAATEADEAPATTESPIIGTDDAPEPVRQGAATWWDTRLIPWLRSSKTIDEFELRLDDLRERIQDYKNTLSPAGAIRAAREIDDIAKEIRGI